MTEQPEVDAAEQAASPYALKNYRLFVLVDVKEKPSARLAVDGGKPFTLKRRFIDHDLSDVRLTAIDGHSIFHSRREDGGAIWRETGVVPTKPEPKSSDAGMDVAEAKASGLILADDLHPAVIVALGGETATDAGRRLPSLELSPAGLNLVNGRYFQPKGDLSKWDPREAQLFDPKGKGLRLKLSSSAKARLKTGADYLGVTVVNAITVFPSYSHLGLVVVELAVHLPTKQPVDALCVQEALHILTNRSRRDSIELAAFKPPVRKNEKAVRGSLGDLIGSALPLRHCDADLWNRLYTYTVLTLEQFPTCGAEEVTDAIAFRCARHYTTDYQLRREQVASAALRPFDSVVHIFSLEGAASVVDGSDKFLGEQFTSRAGQLYLWLVALAYHEHAYLIDVVQIQVPDAVGVRPNFAKLKSIIGAFLYFRLRHRMPIVSDIEMHNEVYAGLRDSLRLDALIGKLSGDAAAFERFTTQTIADEAEDRRKRRVKRAKKSARRDALPSAIIVLGLTFLAFSSLVEKVEKLVLPRLSDSEKDISILVVGTLFAAVGFALDYKKKKRASETDDAEVADEIEDGAVNVSEDDVDAGDLEDDLKNAGGAAVAQRPS